MPYPVAVAIEPQVGNRNRLTTLFRLVLAIPHLILVGGPGFVFGARLSRSGWALGGENGLLGAVIFFLAFASWITILVSGLHIAGIREITAYYMRWKLRATAYFMLLTDRYPPFGDGEFPAALTIVDPTAPRRRLTVAFRLLLAIPHFIVLAFVTIVWCIATIIAWFAILFTAAYPEGLVTFSVGVVRWYFRLEAYILLMVDEYPPFSLQ